MQTIKNVILAIDWGERRIGLALSDDLRIMAHPYGTINNSDTVYEEIRDTARERDVGLILFGLPLTLAGEEGEMAQKVREFGSSLVGYLGDIPIKYFDERLTTGAAEAVIKEMEAKGVRKKNRGKASDVDAIAAALLLETYLGYLENQTSEADL